MPGSISTQVIKSVLPGIVGLSNNLNGIILDSTTDGIVARSGGGQALATVLTSKFNRIITVAVAADSALLPPAVAGLAVTVRNDGANAANIFPQNNGDIINALAVNTALSVGAASTTTFRCYTTGKWIAN